MSTGTIVHGDRFRLGVNYWPSASAMGWWKAFDRAQLAGDLARIASAGFDSVRIFLQWEDFQPTPFRVDEGSVANLIATLDEAAKVELDVMPTLFTGHMSGVNWIPTWALGEEAADRRFRIVAGGRVVPSRLANWYTDATIGNAQTLLAGELARAVAGHHALWAWDLGNENSNCSLPPKRDDARKWLARVTGAIRAADSR
jgi:endo-1,4-beta-mannosidase